MLRFISQTLRFARSRGSKCECRYLCGRHGFASVSTRPICRQDRRGGRLHERAISMQGSAPQGPAASSGAVSVARCRRMFPRKAIRLTDQLSDLSCATLHQANSFCDTDRSRRTIRVRSRADRCDCGRRHTWRLLGERSVVRGSLWFRGCLVPVVRCLAAAEMEACPTGFPTPRRLAKPAMCRCRSPLP